MDIISFQKKDLRNTVSNMIVVILITTTFLSCTGHSKIDTKKAEPEQEPIGEIVDTLDPKANLIYQHRDDTYWFGSDKGVYKYDGKRLLLFTTKDGLINHRVIGVQEDKLGNIYFDTPKGVSKFDGHQFTTLKVMESHTQKNQWKLEPDDLWFRIGWDNKGPFRFDGENLYPLEFPKSGIEDEFYAKYPNVSYNPYGIFSMYKDSKGNMWFGTSDLGIYRFNGNQIGWMHEEHLSTTPEGGAFGIRSIIEDKNGFFWISNESYKYKILPDSINDTEPILINYKREKGIKNSEEEVQYFHSMVTDNNGDLWMVNANGVWKNNGEELIHYPAKDGERDILILSIYNDNQGELWIGSSDNGAYKFNGKSFEKFTLNTNKSE